MRWKSILLVAALAPAAAADQFDFVRTGIRRRLEQSTHVPSLAVAVAQNGKILWEEGFGWADREKKIPATGHTVYSLASVSKPITATGLMALKQRGRIELDRPINNYLGPSRLTARVGRARDATVRRVANHTSGLPLHYQFFYFDEPYRPPAMPETIRRYGNLVTAPGEKYEYSNLGYGVLDHVIERVSGRSYAEFMRREVFLPLGMTRSSVGIGADLEKHQALRYGPDGSPLPFYDFDHRGGSAIFSSAHDLVRFGLFHLKTRLPDQKAILSDQNIDEMQRPTAEDGRGGGYGIGWATGQIGAWRVVRHGGGMPGVSTALVLVPSEKLVVAVLANASSAALDQLVTYPILSAAAPVGIRSGTVEKPAAGGLERTPASFEPPGSLVGTWTGKLNSYRAVVPFTLWIRESGEIEARLDDQVRTPVTNPGFREGYLTGRLTGHLGTEEVNRGPYLLHLSLKLRGQTLNGAVAAVSLPRPRVRSALSHWVELMRAAETP